VPGPWLLPRDRFPAPEKWNMNGASKVGSDAEEMSVPAALAAGRQPSPVRTLLSLSSQL
jgi:hypothetical protein